MTEETGDNWATRSRHGRVFVTYEHPGALKEELWVFGPALGYSSVFHLPLYLRLVSYFVRDRPSRRYKYREVEGQIWHASTPPRDRGRDLPAADVPLPPLVVELALEEARAQVSILPFPPEEQQ